MSEEPNNRMIRLMAGSLGAVLLGMFIIAGLVVFKKFHAEKSVDCTLPKSIALPTGGLIENVEDRGNFFLVTLVNRDKTMATLVSVERCTGKTMLVSQFNIKPD